MADTEFIDILNASEAVADDVQSLRATAKPLPETLPILGLSDIVLFPGMVTPLLVESGQSIKLIDDVVGGDRFVGLVLQTKPEVQEPKPEDMWSHGCAGRVLKMLKFPDNTARILVEGLRRFQLKEFVAHEPYLRARVELLNDLAEDSVELAALARNASQIFTQIISLSPALSDQVKVSSLNQESPGKLADLIAANLNLDLQERQRLLEITSVKERLGRQLPLLQRELEVLTLGSKIQKEVTTSMSKSQRDFFCGSRSGRFSGNLASPTPPRPTPPPCVRRSTGPSFRPMRAKSLTRNWSGSSKRPRPSPNTASPATTSTGSRTCRGASPPRTNWIWMRPQNCWTSSIMA